MQVGVIEGICLLAFLLSEGRAEELDSLKESKDFQDVDNVKQAVGLRKSGEAPSDLRSEISLAVIQSNSQVNEGRSRDVAQSDARSFEDSVVSSAAQSSGDGSASAYADSIGVSSQSRATDVAGGAPASPLNPFNEELGPYLPPGSSFSQAEAQAINSNSYVQGLKSYPYPASYPYSSGFSSAQSQTNNELYQPSPNSNLQADGGLYQRDPVYNPYGQGLIPGQAQNQADNGLYQPAYNGPPNVSPYNQGSSFPPGQDSESNQPIIEPNSVLPKPVPRLNRVSDSFSASPSSYPYSSGSTSSSTYTQDSGNSGPYQTVPIPDPDFSPYERLLVPYKGPSSTQTHEISEVYQPVRIIKSKEDQHESNSRPYSQEQNQYGFASSNSYGHNEPYQAIPLPDPDPSPYDAFLVPYRDPNPPQAQTDNEPYQPIPIPKHTSKQLEASSRVYSEPSYSSADYHSSHSNSFIHNSTQPPSPADRGLHQAIPISNPGSYIKSSFSQKQINNGAYQTIPIPNNSLRMKPTQDDIQPYQSIPVLDSDFVRYKSSMDQFREPNYEKIKLQSESNAYGYQPVPNSNDPKSDATLSSASTYNVGRSREYAPAIDDIDSSADIISKSSWDPYEYNPYAPSGPYPQLYTSGADAAQAYPDFKPATSGIPNPYSQGISPYVTDYPSESPVRPEGYNPSENDAQAPPDVFASGQSSSIAFEDAKSRAILPHEYVFPNKMPGGENAIQCTKENEFHHFWSQELDCLICICLNEYGVLQPVCASCGGCHNPPRKFPEIVPRLPESIPVQPATTGPFEPIPIMPEPYPPMPKPEPKPEPPIQEPYQPVPTPEPYPEPVPPPSPVPVTFPEPMATLPPPPAQAHCNPLPTGVPFTNPLHPCQICICRESFVTGKTDVQIECKENPQCIAPADVTALPPIPDVPMPIPLPICEKFPEDVLFPHPTEACKLCKCAKSLSEDGVYEQQITCYPHPDCVPKLEAVTEPVPPLPLPVDPYQVKPYPEPEPLPIEPQKEPYQPMEPVPLPEVVTVEPLPWPPITTIAPAPVLPVTPRPGPLPGPSPHESCRPYPPNQTFQHPWDECQVCVCTEATAVGLITVEVNCYTKPSCCIDPPDSVKQALPGKLLLFIGFNVPYIGLGNAVKSPEVQALSSVSQPITSTYRPPPAYPSYSPRSVSVYPGNNQVADPLNQLSLYSGYVNPSSSYPYQPNYAHPYVNPQYSEYPPRLPVHPGTGNTIGQYKPNNFRYPANYQYAQGDAVGSNYPPQVHYQPFDPRFQTVPATSYPGIYQRAYERPSMYASKLRDGYVKPPVPALGAPDIQNLSPSYSAPIEYSKSGKDGQDDDSR